MSLTINVIEAEQQFPALLQQTLQGEEVIITSEGIPVARLSPAQPVRKPGSAKGLLKMAPDFDDPLPETILKDFGL